MSHHDGKDHLTLEQVTVPRGHALEKVPKLALIVGVAGLLVSAALGAMNAKQFFFSYLVAFSYFLSLALGGLFFVLVQHAVRAGWSVVVRRLAENVSMALDPALLVLFLPVAAGVGTLYHWSHPEAVDGDPILMGKAVYLNIPFFLGRAAVFLGVLFFLARWFRSRSVEQDKSKDHALTHRMQRVAGPALLAFALALSYGAIDWIKSLDPHWFSTMFGVYFFAGSALGFFSFLMIVILRLRRAGILNGVVTTEHQHDVGKFMFGFIIFWTYVSFSQYFLIWYANIPEETVWYAHRAHGSWFAVSVFLCVFHFGVPFLFLLSRHVKRKDQTVILGASWLLFMHFVDLHWVIMPVLHTEGFSPTLLDLTTFIGVGGVFLWGVTRRFLTDPLVPVGDPRLGESLRFQNF